MNLTPQVPFHFNGTIPSSKSMLNRALILQSWRPSLEVMGQSCCDDVVYMRQGLQQLKEKPHQPFDCGQAGTTLRFLAFRLSREPGTFKLTGSHHLMSRPQRQIANVLRTLGVTVFIGSDHLMLEGRGWQDPKGRLVVERNESSQFLSGLIMNAWELPFALEIEWSGKVVSDGYLKLTIAMLRELGMVLHEKPWGLEIPRGQRMSANKICVEPDMSSAFAVAALAAVNGSATFKSFPRQSLQPDFIGFELLRTMGARVDRRGDGVEVRAHQDSYSLKGITIDLNSTPDLFPVLAVLCGLAEGRSQLFGAPHLAHKESKRLEKTAELLKFMQVSFILRKDGLEIEACGRSPLAIPKFSFDPAEDHRMAMAAAVASQAGYQVDLANPQVVRKSFPEFWDIFGMQL